MNTNTIVKNFKSKNYRILIHFRPVTIFLCLRYPVIMIPLLWARRKNINLIIVSKTLLIVYQVWFSKVKRLSRYDERVDFTRLSKRLPKTPA